MARWATKKYSFLKILGLFLLFTLINLGVFSRQALAGDFQLWTELGLAYRIAPSKFTLIWSTENRFRDTATDYFFFNTTLGFSYELFNWWELGPKYRYEKEFGKPGENRFIFEMEFKLPVKVVSLKNRQRYTLRFFPDETRFRFRNRFKLAKTFAERPVSYSPFISSEIFVEQGRGLNQHRLSFGNSFGVLQDHLNFALYFLWAVRRGSEEWQNTYVLGTSLLLRY